MFSGLQLTVRGATLLLGGLAVSVAAATIGEPDLAWIGVFLVAFPVVGAVMVLLTRPHLTYERLVEPAQVPIGQSPRTSLLIRNRMPLSLSSLEFRDRIPDELGSDAGFNLTRAFGRWDQVAGYEIPATQRGHFTVGPLRVRSFDPFGTAVASWKVKGEPTSLRITPRIWNLEKMRSGVSSGSAGEATPQRIGQAGQDDVLVREHPHGDDMRRVHWRMSAKQGELMVRLEEHPWDPSLTLMVDNRTAAHFGSGPDSTLEWCISAAASVASDLLGNRYRVTILSADDVIFTPRHGEATGNREAMIRALTDVRGSGRRGLESSLSDWEALSSSHTLLAALGLLTAEDAAVLSSVGIHMLTATAVVPDAAAWGASREQYDQHKNACRLLRSSGWDIQEYRPGELVPDVWSTLVKRGGRR